MAKKAKLLFSSPWGRRILGFWEAASTAKHSRPALCSTILARYFTIPRRAQEIRVHLYDASDHKDCVMFRLRREPTPYSWCRHRVHFTTRRRGTPQGYLFIVAGQLLGTAPLGWKNGKATVYAEIEWR